MLAASHSLYPVKGAIKQALTPTPIKNLEINREKKLLDIEKIKQLMTATDIRKRITFFGPNLSSQ
jgi:hypothetical protein